MVTFVCLLVAFILFTLAAIGVTGRVNLLACGLAFWVLSDLLPALLNR